VFGAQEAQSSAEGQACGSDHSKTSGYCSSPERLQSLHDIDPFATWTDAGILVIVHGCLCHVFVRGDQHTILRARESHVRIVTPALDGPWGVGVFVQCLHRELNILGSFGEEDASRLDIRICL
jgi:hypothetical protein